MEVVRPQIIVVGGRQYRKNPLNYKYKGTNLDDTAVPYVEETIEGLVECIRIAKALFYERIYYLTLICVSQL